MNTHRSDLNELAVGYALNNFQWWCTDARLQFQQKAKLVREANGSEDVTIQVERGRAMAETLRIQWIAKTGVPFIPEHIVWCAREGVLQKTIPTGFPASHPADLVVKLNTGSWLGISCKSRDSKFSELTAGLKNPGVKTIENALNIEISPVVRSMVDIVVDEGLPKTQDARKKAIRALPPEQQIVLGNRGRVVLAEIRSRVFNALVHHEMTQATLHAFLRNTLLDISDEIHPKYVIVVGSGTRESGFKAKLHDPFAMVPKDGRIFVFPVGDYSIGFKCDQYPVCLLRPKWESEPLASSLKFSVDPWES